MFEWLKIALCKHGEMKIIEEMTFINGFGWSSDRAVPRRYMICLKCGHKRKISNS